MNAKRLLALLLALVMVIGLAACGGTTPPATNPPATNPPATDAPTTPAPVATYIPAPYTVADATELTAKFLEPKFYENENGPTIGVTLLGVIEIGGQYFRDLNNNKELDTFEDWRLDADTRAEAFAAAMTDDHLVSPLVNVMAYSPVSTATDAVVDENGNPVWTKVFSNTLGFSSGGGADAAQPTGADVINMWDTEGFRTFVLRSNPSTEVGVWFNNGLEQYAEYDAVVNGEIAIPYLTFTNPIAHGLPGNEGVAAAVMGDGNADIVLKDSQLYRQSMWARGIDAIYGHQVDLVTDPRWSRNNGTYGENEVMISKIAHAFVEGFQNGTNGLVEGSVLLTIKHFPGDGAAFNGFESHGQTGRYRIYSTENSLADYQLKPFIAAFEAGCAGTMPGYSQPIIDERIAPQSITYNGKTYDIKLEGAGNAFNTDVIDYLLREVLGFDGLINSDSLNPSCQQGVDNLTSYERMVLFVNSGNQAGVISFDGSSLGGLMGDGDGSDPEELMKAALEKGDIKIETLRAAAAARAKVQIMTGNMDCPYRSLEEAKTTIATVDPQIAALAEETHLKSVVLMKNINSTLPLKDTTKTVYIAGFNQKDDYKADAVVAAIQAAGFTVVDDYTKADIAYMHVSPTIVGQGSSNLAILDLAEDVETPIYDNNAKRTEDTALITTVANMKGFKKVADAVHANGGIVIGRIEADNAWILSNMEPYCDALLGTFSTSEAAVTKVLTGEYNPTGKLPITMVADASVIALVETEFEGGVKWDVCVSPNDVPGYVKDQYMSADVLAASPSGSYAYKDAAGNFYRSGFGLDFNSVSTVVDPSTEPETTEPAETKPAETDKPATSTTTANIALDFASDVKTWEGEWTLTAVYANGATTAAVENALSFEIKLEEDPSELVDGPAYIHNHVWNLSGVLTFGLDSINAELSADDVESYKGTTSWEAFPQGKVVEEGGWYEQPGPATMRFKDIDDYGLFLDKIAGASADIDTTNKSLIIGSNTDGQLLLGFSEEHLERPGTEGEFAYVLIFTKK